MSDFHEIREMKILLPALLLFVSLQTRAQLIDSLNTAKNCEYMKAEEREMIYEINRVRSDPPSYLPYIQPLLDKAKQNLEHYGKGAKGYSLTYHSSVKNGVTQQAIDTNWHYENEEEVKALSSLVNELKKMKRLSVLQPDSGIYNAAKKHAADQDAHEWKLMHTGSDGSAPWDRIMKYSPSMSFGNENLAGRAGLVTSARSFVIQLLIDAGIPGYGHRENLLDPAWTHVACVMTHYYEMYWCIQNFGVKKK